MEKLYFVCGLILYVIGISLLSAFIGLIAKAAVLTQYPEYSMIVFWVAAVLAFIIFACMAYMNFYDDLVKKQSQQVDQ